LKLSPVEPNMWLGGGRSKSSCGPDPARGPPVGHRCSRQSVHSWRWGFSLNHMNRWFIQISSSEALYNISKHDSFTVRRWRPHDQPPSEAGGPRLVGCPQLHVQYIRSYLPYISRGRLLHQQPQTRHAVVTRNPLNMDYNIILPSTSGSPKCTLPFRLTYWHSVYYVPYLAHSFYIHINHPITFIQ
jgi:hypothetical protein